MSNFYSGFHHVAKSHVALLSNLFKIVLQSSKNRRYQVMFTETLDKCVNQAIHLCPRFNLILRIKDFSSIGQKSNALQNVKFNRRYRLIILNQQNSSHILENWRVECGFKDLSDMLLDL